MLKRAHKDTDIYNAPLSAREVHLLASWERARKIYVTMADVRAAAPTQHKNVVRGLVAKGVLSRIGRGRWIVRPMRALLHPSTPSGLLLLAVLLHDEPHYIGGLWAFTHHGMSAQHYVSTLDAFVTRHRAARELGGARVRFYVVPRRAMSYGIEPTMVEGVETFVSDRERTLLDVLDHPRAVGGLRRAVDLASRGLPHADHEKLISYAVLGSRHSTCQRLGVLLEREGAAKRRLAPLHARAREKSSLLSMVPGQRVGPVSTRWNVVENDR